MSEKPFSHLEVPNIRDPYLTREEIALWVKPFYMADPTSPEFRRSLRGIYASIDEPLVRRLLSFFDWRPKVVGSYFAILTDCREVEDLIGRLLLRSDVCYAGSAFCLALAHFQSERSREYLKTYLDCYLRRPDLCYDQRQAMDALAYLDALHQHQDVAEIMPLWQKFLQERPGWQWDPQQGAASVAAQLRNLRLCARGLAPTRLSLLQGDITQQTVDAIVNAANSSLLGGGGVDGAIHRAAGPSLLQECKEVVRRQGECPVGEAVLTSAGDLPARYVIHTVGPQWQGGGEHESQLLANCYRNCLLLAVEKGLESLAFPCISTGAYGYPPAAAAQIAVASVKEFVERQRRLAEVRFVVYRPSDHQLYLQLGIPPLA